MKILWNSIAFKSIFGSVGLLIVFSVIVGIIGNIEFSDVLMNQYAGGAFYTADAAALKAAKLTISGAVPVVGGILSDASEAILVSASLAKNAAGIYGLLAFISIAVLPFVKIGIHYLLLKVTTATCGIFGIKSLTNLLKDYASAMGLLLGMTGAVSLLMMISTVCFMRGIR